MDAETLAEFERNTTRGKTTECWLWRGKISSGGTAVMTVRGSQVFGQNVAYELEYGPIPEGHWVFHRNHCRHRDCVNPRHLVAMTPEESRIGSNNRSAKLTEAIVLDLRDRWRATSQKPGPWSAAEARRLGVNPRTIRKVIERKTWTHI